MLLLAYSVKKVYCHSKNSSLLRNLLWLMHCFFCFAVMHPEKGEDEKEERDTVYVVEVPVTEKYGRKLFYQR